jgi:F420-dependent methylenetetrahydromethanopterin dehydrogenase
MFRSEHIAELCIKSKTMTHKTFIYDQHLENQDWLKRLDFYKEDLIILRERLEEVTSKNNNADFLKSVEHFQNQFLIQRNHIDELAHEIKANENTLVAEIQDNPVAVDHRKVENHDNEADFMGYFEKNFAELRAEFNVFLAKWM